MKRRQVLGMAAVAGLTPLGVSAQEDTAPDDKRAARRIEVARRWEEEAQGKGNAEVLRDLASPDYASSDPRNAPGVDALVERYARTAERLAAYYDAFSVKVEASAVSATDVAVRTEISAERAGRVATVTGMGWYVFDDDDLVVMGWGLLDEAALTQQLFS
jgi:hypothetical protein